MPRLKAVDVSEKELEQLLVDDPACIEDGMQVLDRQVPTDSGPLDILASDRDKVLSIIELKVALDDGQLDQGLRYYDWARTNVARISRHYAGKVDVDLDREPWLILVAPGFSKSLRRIAKYVTVPLKLRQYRVLQMPDGQKGVLCTSVDVDVPEPPGPLRIPTHERNLGNIKAQDVRSLCETAIEQLQEVGVEPRPKQNYWFSCWYGGRSLMWLGCKQKFFVIESPTPDGSWKRRRVVTPSDWEAVLQDEILPLIRDLHVERGGEGPEVAP